MPQMVRRTSAPSGRAAAMARADAIVAASVARSQGKLLPIKKRFYGAVVRIGFPDSRTQRLFNNRALLEARYGDALAARIAVRLAVLGAARRLSVVPRHPPVRLDRARDRPAVFTVDLTPGRRLRFVAVGAGAGDGAGCDPAAAEEIEVLGVD